MTTKANLIEVITAKAMGTQFEVMIPFLSTMKKDDLLVINQKVDEVATPKTEVKAEAKFTDAEKHIGNVMKAIFVSCQVKEKKLVSKKTIKEALEFNKITLEYAEIEAVLDILIKRKEVSYMRNEVSKIPFFGLTKKGAESLPKYYK